MIGSVSSDFVPHSWHGTVITGNGIVIIDDDMESSVFIDSVDGKDIIHADYGGVDDHEGAHHLFLVEVQ